MKIAVLTKNINLYSHQRLLEAGRERGHEMTMLNTQHCYMKISCSKPHVHERGGKLVETLDAVIPRIGVSNTFYGTAVLRQFEMQGVFTLNDSLSITRSRDKLRSLQLLARKGVPMPVTGFAKSPQDTDDLIQIAGGVPLIIKLLEGTQGRGVILAESIQAATSVIGTIKQLKGDMLVQEYIEEAKGSDIRCFVVGDRVVASMQRTAPEGDFRSNVHQGGTTKAIKITKEERAMAVKASKAMGLKVSGVDIIRANRGSLVIEINSSPGLEGIEKATGVDVAGKMIEFIEKNAHKKKKA
jgi:ribosomal protein S6--L-glutamate ligase